MRLISPGHRRVAFLTQFFPPEQNGPANRIGIVADAISELAPVTVYAPAPSYPNPEPFARIDVAELDGRRSYPIRRTELFRAHGGATTRAAREWRLARSLAELAARDRPAIVWATAPTMFLVPAAVSMAQRLGVPVVIDLRDLTWLYAKDSPTFATGPLRPLVDLLERWIMRSLGGAQRILVTNEGARAILTRKGVSAERVSILANGVDRERFDQLSALPDPPVAGKRPVVTYCGLVGHNQGLGILLEVAERVPDVSIVVAGGGPELDRLRGETERRLLSNLEWLGQVPWHQVLDLYSKSTVLFGSLASQGSLRSTAVPSKVYEYMAAGRPIVYAGGGVAGDLVAESGAGLVAEGVNPEDVVSALRILVGDPTRARAMGNAGRARARLAVREVETRAVVPRTLAGLGVPIGEGPGL